jgi:hypothetical protein
MKSPLSVGALLSPASSIFVNATIMEIVREAAGYRQGDEIKGNQVARFRAIDG